MIMNTIIQKLSIHIMHQTYQVKNILGDFMNATITIAEIIGGILSGSLALLSDAVHNLSDTVSIALSYFANKIA